MDGQASGSVHFHSSEVLIQKWLDFQLTEPTGIIFYSAIITMKFSLVSFACLVGFATAFAPMGQTVAHRPKSTKLDMALNSGTIKTAAIATTAAVAASTAAVKFVFDRPSRTYSNATINENTVAQEYDAWADDGILEYYWGEHIHLGYYSEEEMKRGYKKKDFIQAKYDFIDEMMKFGGIEKNSDKPLKVLDVGCGFGGTSRYLAKNLGENAHVTGITLSPKQVERGTQLAEEQGVAEKTEFRVMDALKMEFEDNTFDIVWACESG